MLTDEQITKLLDTHRIHDTIYPWVRKHVLDVQYGSLTAQQRKTLQLILDMHKSEQKDYVIIKDKLVKTPTKVQKYAKTQGKWEKREGKMPLQYHNRKL